MTGLPLTTSATLTAPVGSGFAAGSAAEVAQAPTAITAAAPLDSPVISSRNVVPLAPVVAYPPPWPSGMDPSTTRM